MTKEQFIREMINSEQVQEDFFNQEYIHDNQYTLSECLNYPDNEDIYTDFISKTMDNYTICTYAYVDLFQVMGIYYQGKLIYSALELYTDDDNVKFHVAYNDGKLHLIESFIDDYKLIIINKDKIEKINMIYL